MTLNCTAIPTMTSRRLDCRVPMDPSHKTAPALKKTPRELLQDKARHISTAAAIEAEASFPLYDVLAYDPETEIVLLRQAMYPQQEPYSVNLRTLECNCIHSTGVVARTNKALAEVGLLPSLHCKHSLICHLKEQADPFLLDSTPRTWERVKAESLTVITEARRASDWGN